MAIVYQMRISRGTVDQLGVKLYDKVSAVIAELLSNSYDADATTVTISAPMGKYLATKQGATLTDHGYEIEVSDDGVGMNPDQMQEFFLVVGKDRRADSRRGDVSKKFGRKVMGRKGVGKLAPFGICREIEVISRGGPKLADGPGAGKYETSHIILDYDQILDEQDQHESYKPKAGPKDGTFSDTSGTTIILRRFNNRKVPDLEQLGRQIAQRFGISASNWHVRLKDTGVGAAPGSEVAVGKFYVQTLEGTRLDFKGPEPTASREDDKGYSTVSGDQSPVSEITPGFFHDGRFYPVVGWVAFAKENYRDDLMAGVRVYCRGKIAAQSPMFNRNSGFTGEQSVRAYFVGELNCDWLDEHEDLIETNRRDILWSHELGAAFEAWGQEVVKQIGRRGRNPIREKMREIFRETGRVKERVDAAFPRPDQKDLRDKAIEVADMLGRALREDEVRLVAVVEPLVSLSIDLAPHITLETKLREAADSEDTPAAVIGSILRTAQLAELHSFGRIAHDRVRVIERLKTLKDDTNTPENDLQSLIESAPWLINPSWAPITANRSLASLKAEFAVFYKERTGDEIVLQDFGPGSKRPDFVSFSIGSHLEIVEIKRPGHKLTNDEVVRIDTYYRAMTDFLNDPGHADFKREFGDFHITLVCDGTKISGLAQTAYDGMMEKKKLERIDWKSFLLRTELAHQEFLNESDRQKRDVGVH